jgi:hypothetical protein
MRTDHSSQSHNGRRATPPPPGPEASGWLRVTGGDRPGFGEAEAGFATLCGCSSLTHHVSLALQAEGVDAAVMPSAMGSSEPMIHVPAGDKEAAIEILLRTLKDTQMSPGFSAGPATVLAA